MHPYSLTISMLPYENWQAIRIITFSIEGLQANFIYKRKIDFTKLTSCSSTQSPQSKYIDNGNGNDSLNLPLDEIDDLLLNWFKVVDQNAILQSKLLIFDSEVRDFMKFYTGFSTAKINMFAFPRFGVKTFEELKKYFCIPIARYNREFEIILYGTLPPNKQLTIIGYYDYSKMKELDELMKKLNQEILKI